MHTSAAAAAGGSNFIADDDDGMSCASTPSADGPTSLRSPNALRALSLLPGLDAQPNADAQQNGDHGHTPLVSGDDSDSGGAASARALAGPMQRAVPNGSGHLVGQRLDAQTNGDAQANGGGDDGRGQLLVTAAAAHRPRRSSVRALKARFRCSVPCQATIAIWLGSAPMPKQMAMPRRMAEAPTGAASRSWWRHWLSAQIHSVPVDLRVDFRRPTCAHQTVQACVGT